MFEVRPGATRLVILQCDSGDVHSDLIACARYNITNEHNQTTLTDGDSSGIVHVLFIVQLPRIAGGCFVGFQVDLLFMPWPGISNVFPPNNSASPRRQGDVMGTACRRRFSTSYSLPFVDSKRCRLDGAFDVVFNVVSTSCRRRMNVVIRPYV